MGKLGKAKKTELAGTLVYRPADLAADEGRILWRFQQDLSVLAAGSK